jgi:hypothetical protein
MSSYHTFEQYYAAYFFRKSSGFFRSEGENRKYYTVGTVPKSIRKIIERGEIDAPIYCLNTHTIYSLISLDKIQTLLQTIWGKRPEKIILVKGEFDWSVW